MTENWRTLHYVRFWLIVITGNKKVTQEAMGNLWTFHLFENFKPSQNFDINSYGNAKIRRCSKGMSISS